MKILVTGAAGFIGYHVIQKLLGRGDVVVGIDNINNYYDTSLKYARLAETGITREAENFYLPVESKLFPAYTFIRMNMEDRDQFAALFNREKFDAVCHLAAQAGVRYSLDNPHAFISSNITGFLNVLECCRYHSVKHLVYASSSSVYGKNSKMPLSTSDKTDQPISLYAVTKKSNELMAHTYSHLFGLPTTGLRFFTVYGPWGRPDMALFLFVKAILENKTIKVNNKGEMVRDFTFIDDIVEGVARVIDNPPTAMNNSAGAISTDIECSAFDVPSPNLDIPVVINDTPSKIYNIGNSNPVKLMDYISEIETYLGKVAKKEFLPMQPGDVPYTRADITDFEETFGFKPRTEVKDGIRKFIAWYVSYYYNRPVMRQKRPKVKLDYAGN